MKILLIEDSDTESELLTYHLEQQNGWKVTRESCLLQGKQTRAAQPFDLVLLDLGLPDSTPEYTVASIPELNSGVPVVVLTGYADPFVKAKAVGAAGFILKDAIREPDKFIKAIREAVDGYIHQEVLVTAKEPPDPRDMLKRMAKTGRLAISDSAINSATPAQAEQLMQGAQINASLEAVNTTLAAQNVTAQEHGLKIDAIDKTTRETNGKVKALRSEMDESNKNVKILMDEREGRILSEEADRLRREGLMVLPRKIGELVKLGSKYAGIALKWLGAVAVAWPALVWLWEHRILLHP